MWHGMVKDVNNLVGFYANLIFFIQQFLTVLLRYQYKYMALPICLAQQFLCTVLQAPATNG